MRLRLKPSFFVAMLICMAFWFVAISFVSAELAPGPEQTIFPRTINFLSQNWITISLVLSELASLLPGPWNGIVQSILRALTKKSRRSK